MGQPTTENGLSKGKVIIYSFVTVLVVYLAMLLIASVCGAATPTDSEVKAYMEDKYEQEFTVVSGFSFSPVFSSTESYQLKSKKYGFVFNVYVEPAMDLEPLFPYKEAYTYDDSDYVYQLELHKELLKINKDIKDKNTEFYTTNKVTDLVYTADSRGVSGSLSFTVEKLSLSDEASIHTAYQVVDKVLSEVRKTSELPRLGFIEITILTPYKMTISVSADGVDFSNYADFRMQFRKSWQEIYGK